MSETQSSATEPWIPAVIPAMKLSTAPHPIFGTAWLCRCLVPLPSGMVVDVYGVDSTLGAAFERMVNGIVAYYDDHSEQERTDFVEALNDLLPRKKS